jgi:hypothetical protein
MNVKRILLTTLVIGAAYAVYKYATKKPTRIEKVRGFELEIEED